MTELSEPYVTGLLADLEPLVPALDAEFRQASERARQIDGELTVLLVRMDEAKRAFAAHQHGIEDASSSLAEHNNRIANVHQEIAALTARAEEFMAEMKRIGEGEVYRRIRRERAKILVQIEDRNIEVTGLKTTCDKVRVALGAAESGLQTEKERIRVVMGELDHLQAQLPKPHLYIRLFEARCARAHCRLFLDRDIGPWGQEVQVAIASMIKLHQELRAGKYRLDKNSDVVGGRAMASAEALYAAVALRNDVVAAQLFGSIVDPTLLFDHVFNVFRVWALGLYISGRHQELGELLAQHDFSTGLRGGYVDAFRGLLLHDARRVSAGLKAIARYEWEVWKDPKLTRGLGVVSLGAAALARLALDSGLAVTLPGPVVPDEIIAGPRRRATRPS